LFFELFHLTVVKPGELLIRIGTVPSRVFCLLEGQISLHSKFVRDTEQDEGANVARLAKGSSVAKQQLDGRLGTETGILKGNMQEPLLVGLEAPMLALNSPYSYVAKTECVLLSVRTDLIMREYELLGGSQVNKFQEKLTV
jgi:hypothetical protein